MDNMLAGRSRTTCELGRQLYVLVHADLCGQFWEQPDIDETGFELLKPACSPVY